MLRLLMVFLPFRALAYDHSLGEGPGQCRLNPLTVGHTDARVVLVLRSGRWRRHATTPPSHASSLGGSAPWGWPPDGGLAVDQRCLAQHTRTLVRGSEVAPCSISHSPLIALGCGLQVWGAAHGCEGRTSSQLRRCACVAPDSCGQRSRALRRREDRAPSS